MHWRRGAVACAPAKATDGRRVLVGAMLEIGMRFGRVAQREGMWRDTIIHLLQYSGMLISKLYPEIVAFWSPLHLHPDI